MKITWDDTCRVTDTIIIIRWHWAASYQSPWSWRRGVGSSYKMKAPRTPEKEVVLLFCLVWWIFVLLDADSYQNKQKRQRGLFFSPHKPAKKLSLTFWVIKYHALSFLDNLVIFSTIPLGNLGQIISLSRASLAFLFNRTNKWESSNVRHMEVLLKWETLCKCYGGRHFIIY